MFCIYENVVDYFCLEIKAFSIKMPHAALQILHPGDSRDETDRIPKNITITNLDIFMYVFAIIGHFVDLGLDINVAIRYFLTGNKMEFGWTLAFILVPAFINTMVSIRMYNQDKELHADSVSNAVTRQKWLRVFILVLQMAPILRFTDALIYALKSRQAERKKDEASQRLYYGLMLKEDSDAALLRIFECFLEAAPQQVLQTSLLYRYYEDMRIHQILSICSSILGMGWCLAAYQRAVRFTQPDKLNMSWLGSMLQVIWHFLVTLSRITSISIIAYLFPYWTVLACFVHIFTMAFSLQMFDRSPFCSNNKIGEIAFSFALGAVYLFTYILPVEARTRYRYAIYYSICFLQNVTCAMLWYLYVDDTMRSYLYFNLVLVFSIVPFVLGLLFMIVYYMFFHPKVRVKIRDSAVNFNAKEETVEAS